MIKSKNKLYFFIFIACLLGNTWLIYNFYNYGKGKTNSTICYFKNVTNIPCPSCGSTRSILLLLKGQIQESILINPLGLLIFIMLIILPIWILFDLMFKKESFYIFYFKFEDSFKKPKYYIPFFIFIVINWIWNIKKQL